MLCVENVILLLDMIYEYGLPYISGDLDEICSLFIGKAGKLKKATDSEKVFNPDEGPELSLKTQTTTDLMDAIKGEAGSVKKSTNESSALDTLDTCGWKIATARHEGCARKVWIEEVKTSAQKDGGDSKADFGSNLRKGLSKKSLQDNASKVEIVQLFDEKFEHG